MDRKLKPFESEEEVNQFRKTTRLAPRRRKSYEGRSRASRQLQEASDMSLPDFPRGFQSVCPSCGERVSEGVMNSRHFRRCEKMDRRTKDYYESALAASVEFYRPHKANPTQGYHGETVRQLDVGGRGHVEHCEHEDDRCLCAECGMVSIRLRDE